MAMHQFSPPPGSTVLADGAPVNSRCLGILYRRLFHAVSPWHSCSNIHSCGSAYIWACILLLRGSLPMAVLESTSTNWPQSCVQIMNYGGPSGATLERAGTSCISTKGDPARTGGALWRATQTISHARSFAACKPYQVWGTLCVRRLSCPIQVEITQGLAAKAVTTCTQHYEYYLLLGFPPPFFSFRLWRHQADQPPASLQLPFVATPADANGDESRWRSPIEASCMQAPACCVIGTYTDYVYGVLLSSPSDTILPSTSIRTARTSEPLARSVCTPSPAPR